MGMGRRRGCLAAAGSSGAGRCCPPTAGAPRSVWPALPLRSATWPSCHRGLEYAGAGPHGEAPEGLVGVGGLGSRALVVGWVAGVVEGAATVAAGVRRVAPGAQAPLPGCSLQRGGQKPDLYYYLIQMSLSALLMLPYYALDTSLGMHSYPLGP